MPGFNWRLESSSRTGQQCVRFGGRVGGWRTVWVMWWQGRGSLKKKEEEKQMVTCDWTKKAGQRCRKTKGEQSDLRQPRNFAEGCCSPVVAGRLLADPVHWSLGALRGRLGWWCAALAGAVSQSSTAPSLSHAARTTQRTTQVNFQLNLWLLDSLHAAERRWWFWWSSVVEGQRREATGAGYDLFLCTAEFQAVGKTRLGRNTTACPSSSSAIATPSM